jgi:hypothetical protein
MPTAAPTSKPAKPGRASVTLPLEISTWLGRRYPRSSKSAAITRVLSEARLGVFNAREARIDASVDLSAAEDRITTAISERLDELEKRVVERLDAEIPTLAPAGGNDDLRQQLDEIDAALHRLTVHILPALGINAAEIETADGTPRPVANLAGAVSALTARIAALETGMEQLLNGVKRIPTELAAATRKEDDIFAPAPKKLTPKELANLAANLVGADYAWFGDEFKKARAKAELAKKSAQNLAFRKS